MLQKNLLQKTPGWSGQADRLGKKVVLNADSETFGSICESGNLKLRLFCADGSAVILSLVNKDDNLAGTGYGAIGVISVTVSKAQLLDTIQHGLEVIFYDKEGERSVPFGLVAVSHNDWLGDVKPLCEHIQ